MVADAARLLAAPLAPDFVGPDDPPAQVKGAIDTLPMAGEPLRHPGLYDFGAPDLFSRVFAQGRAQFFGAGCARTPPPDLLFLQRKFIGSFVLCTRLRARVDLRVAFGVNLR